MIDKISNFVLGHAYAQSPTFNEFFGFNLVGGGAGNPQATLTNLLRGIVNWVLVIVAIIAFFYLIASGIKYITSGGDAAKATEARNGIVNAIIGIIIVLLSFIIVRFAFGVGQGLGTN